MPSFLVSAWSRALSIVLLLSPVIGCSSDSDNALPAGTGGENGGSGGDEMPDAGSVGTGGEATAGSSTGGGTGGDSTGMPNPMPDADSGSVPTMDAGQGMSDDDGPSMVPEASVDLSSTQAILDSRGADCFSCAQMNGCLDPAQSGSTCEMVPGNAMSGVTESALCLKTLNDIFVSQCNGNLIIDRCLCGPIDLTACEDGTATPVGPIYADYVADYGNDINKIITDLETLTFGASVANVIAECVGLYGCPCQ